jgi:hypothetical protein
MPIHQRLDRALRADPPFLSLVFIALSALVAYAAAPWNGWAIDDVVIAAHPLLQSVRTLPAAMVSPWWYPTQHLYRPLTTGSIGLELLLGGGAPWLPHAVNVVLHAVASVLVARLCRRWLPATASIVAGLYFALLPAHGEAVATLAARAELLAAVALLAMLLVITSDATPTPRTRLLVALASAAALASKEGGVAAPILAVGAAWAYPAARPHTRRWATAALAGTLVMLLARIGVLGELGGDVPHALFRTLSAAERIPVALSLLPITAGMLFLPMRPAINDAPPLALVLAPSPARVVVGAILVMVALAALVLHLRRPSVWTLGMLIISATAAPTANLLFATGVVLSGRSVYAPSMGAALLVGAALAWLLATRLRRVALIASACYLGTCAVLTWNEVLVWRGSESAIAAAAERSPNSYWVPMTRAYRARDAGRTAEALTQFRSAADLLPFDSEMLSDGAALALAQGDTAEATRWLRTAIRVNPRARRARARLASVLSAQGDAAGSRRLIEEGLRVEPDQRTWAELLPRER